MPIPANDWKAWLRPGRSFAELFAADASATPIAPFATLALVLATATALGANRSGLIPPRHLPAVSDAPPAEPGWPLLLHRLRVLAPHHVTFAHTSAEHFRAFVHTDSLSHWAFSSALADVLAAAEPDPGGGLRWPREARWWERGQGPFDVHALALELLARAERHAEAARAAQTLLQCRKGRDWGGTNPTLAALSGLLAVRDAPWFTHLCPAPFCRQEGDAIRLAPNAPPMAASSCVAPHRRTAPTCLA